MFIGITWLLAPEIGVYAAPIGMIVGFYLPALFLYIKGQRNKPLIYPYREVATALALAVVIAGINQLVPEYNHWLELARRRGAARPALDRRSWCRSARSPHSTGSRCST